MVEAPDTTGKKSENKLDLPPRIVIKPSKGWPSVNLKELGEYRELLYFLVWRDLKVRYKQTLLGVAWVILQPFITMVVFSVLFGRLVGVPTHDTPYPIFAYAGLLPWQLFAATLAGAGNSLVANSHLIAKVYFPRLIIPVASVMSGIVDFAVASLILIALMFYYGIVPGPYILTVPYFVLLAVSCSLAVGLWLSPLNVRYRDVRHVIPFLIQTWFFVTPVVYPSNLVPEGWRFVYWLNPMTGVVEGFRWAVLGKEIESGFMAAASGMIVLFLLAGGLIFFRRMERTFADVV